MFKFNRKFIALFLVLALFLPNLSLATRLLELATPRLDPSSSFYFLKIWWEKIQLFFAFLPSWKANLHLKFSEARLAEMNKLAERRNFRYNSELAEAYIRHLKTNQEILTKEVDKGKDVRSLLERFKEQLVRHQAVLLKVLEGAPEQAKDALKVALEASQKGQLQAIEAIQKSKK